MTASFEAETNHYDDACRDESLQIQGTFSWSSDPSVAPAIRSLNLEIPRGELVAIVGGVGSGKSALLQAILGELMPDEAEVKAFVSRPKVIAYCSQVPYIAEGTLKASSLMLGIWGVNAATADEGPAVRIVNHVLLEAVVLLLIAVVALCALLVFLGRLLCCFRTGRQGLLDPLLIDDEPLLIDDEDLEDAERHTNPDTSRSSSAQTARLSASHGPNLLLH
eukprot:s2418_g14.t1